MLAFFVICMLTAAANVAGPVEVSPKTAGATVPGQYSWVRYTLSDGNWTGRVSLPENGTLGGIIEIVSNAQYDTEIITVLSDIPVASVTLKRGSSLKFVYGPGRWKYASPKGTQSSRTTGTQIALRAGEAIAFYSLTPLDFAPFLTLPSSASDGQMIFIRSTTDQAARVAPSNLLYNVTLDIRAGDYLLTYSTAHQRWLVASVPERVSSPDGIASTAWLLSAPKSAVSHYQIFNDAYRPYVQLPTSAGDRDRIFISSFSTTPATILSGANVEYKGTMGLRRGDTYEFMYIAEKGLWTTRAAPDSTYSPAGSASLAYSLPLSQAQPKIVYTASDTAWASEVILPQFAKSGDRVLVQSTAAKPFVVRSASGQLAKVAEGDMIRFQYGLHGWERATRQITLLMAYSDGASARLGAAAMRARLAAGLRLTNEALENSGGNYFMKAAGFFQHEVAGESLDVALPAAVKDQLLQKERNRLAADGIYYEGSEAGCGLAYVGPSAGSMVASGSLNCGTTVMRHELGHNMGLQHCDGGVIAYAHGNAITKDIMCGNAIPYYSTPKLYTAIGIPLGEENVTDAVRAINDRSAYVSGFR